MDANTMEVEYDKLVEGIFFNMNRELGAPVQLDEFVE